MRCGIPVRPSAFPACYVLKNMPDLAIEVVRKFSLWSLDLSPALRIYNNVLYRWCLDTFGQSLALPLSDTQIVSGGVDKEDKEGDDTLIKPAKLRPLARLLAAVDPHYAELFMLRFARGKSYDRLNGFYDTCTHRTLSPCARDYTLRRRRKPSVRCVVPRRRAYRCWPRQRSSAHSRYFEWGYPSPPTWSQEARSSGGYLS